MNLIAECDCHVWVVRAFNPMGRCGRCKRVPRVIGDAEPDAKTICKHEGDCR